MSIKGLSWGLSIAGAVFLLVFILLIVVRQKLVNRLEDVKKKFADRNVLKHSYKANIAGVKSYGPGMVRGNGVLFLLEDTLYFEMLLPRKVVEIPLEKIIDISTPKKFLLKTKGMPMLRIDFLNEDDQEDAAAWWVSDLDGWIEAIKEQSLNKTRKS